MSSMPTIDDDMVHQFRRTGQRRFYATRRGIALVSRNSRVVPQIAGLDCANYPNCTPCEGGVCWEGTCVSIHDPRAAQCRR
jgi:hypothetical protein